MRILQFGFVHSWPNPGPGYDSEYIFIKMASQNSIDSSIVGFGSSSIISAATDSPEINKEAEFINGIYDVVVKVSGFVITKCMFKDQLCLIILH